jgi:hypothetical protein
MVVSHIGRIPDDDIELWKGRREKCPDFKKVHVENVRRLEACLFLQKF